MPGTVGNFLEKCQRMSGFTSKHNGDQSDLLAVSAMDGRAREGLWLSRSRPYAGCALARLKCGVEDGGCTCLEAWMLRERGAARLHQSGDHTNQPRHTPQTIRPSAPCRNQDKREVDSMTFGAHAACFAPRIRGAALDECWVPHCTNNRDSNCCTLAFSSSSPPGFGYIRALPRILLRLLLMASRGSWRSVHQRQSLRRGCTVIQARHGVRDFLLMRVF